MQRGLIIISLFIHLWVGGCVSDPDAQGESDGFVSDTGDTDPDGTSERDTPPFSDMMVADTPDVALDLAVDSGEDEQAPVDVPEDLDGGQSPDMSESPDVLDEPDGSQEPDAQPISPRYDETVYRSTHNSYSGQERGSVLAQLQGGVRFLELDVHDNDYQRDGDFRVGHDNPGDELARGDSNPVTDRLGAWLEVIAQWSDANPDHAPLTIGIDLKDNLTDNRSFAEGNLAALNERVRDAFGLRLYTAAQASQVWPTVRELRGRIIVVLSGDGGTRRAYRWDGGANPAVAIDGEGRVLEVHDSGSGRLWFWSGQYEDDASIRWERHGRYDTGQTPAVAVGDNGWIIEVHQSESRQRLFYRLGRLRNDLDVTWYDSHDYADGHTPTVRFSTPDGLEVNEIHQDQRGRTMRRVGVIDTRTQTVLWQQEGLSPRPVWEKTVAVRGQRTVEVMLGSDRAAPEDTLRYVTGQGGAGRIVYAQVLFTELQSGDVLGLGRDELRFAAAHADDAGWLAQQRQRGTLVRAWVFDEQHQVGVPPIQFPATDHPFERWYDSVCEQRGCSQ